MSESVHCNVDEQSLEQIVSCLDGTQDAIAKNKIEVGNFGGRNHRTMATAEVQQLLDGNGEMLRILTRALGLTESGELEMGMVTASIYLLNKVRRFAGDGETDLEHTLNMLRLLQQLLSAYPEIKARLGENGYHQVVLGSFLHDIGEAVHGDAVYSHSAKTVNGSGMSQQEWDVREQRCTGQLLDAMVRLSPLQCRAQRHQMREKAKEVYRRFTQRGTNVTVDDFSYHLILLLDVLDGQLGVMELEDKFVADAEQAKRNLDRMAKAFLPVLKEPLAVRMVMDLVQGIVGENDMKFPIANMFDYVQTQWNIPVVRSAEPYDPSWSAPLQSRRVVLR